MIYSPGRWIQAHLIDQRLGSDPEITPRDAWPIFLAIMPDDSSDGTTDNAIAIHDIPGKKAGRFMRGGQTIIQPGLMVNVRGVNHDDAYDRISQIGEAFDAIQNTVITIGLQQIQVASISRRPIMPLGTVVGTRTRTAFNFFADLTYAFA
jgi:hypothetical protein